MDFVITYADVLNHLDLTVVWRFLDASAREHVICGEFGSRWCAVQLFAIQSLSPAELRSVSFKPSRASICQLSLFVFCRNGELLLDHAGPYHIALCHTLSV